MAETRFLDVLGGRRGLINDGLSVLAKRSFLPENLVIYSAAGKNLEYLGCLTDKIEAGSIGFSVDEAKIAAVGEYVERFCGATPAYSELLYGSHASLAADGLTLLNPTDISLFAPWQYAQENFPFKQFTTNDEVHWIKGRNFLTDTEIWLPAFLVYWGFYSTTDEFKYVQGTSTGHAAGATLLDAIRSGFFESIERHAFCDFWYNQNIQQYITYSSETILNTYINPKIQSLFKNKRVKFKVFDLGNLTDIEAIVVFIFFEYKGRLLFSCGSSARFTKEEAIIKSCLEAYQGVDLAIHLVNKIKWEADYKSVLQKINDYDDHFNFYNAFPELRHQSPIFVEALRDEASEKEIVQHPSRIMSFDKTSLQGKKNIGPFFWVDLSSRQWPDLPFKVVKVVMPNQALLTGTHNSPFLGNDIFEQKENLFIELPHCFP